MTTKAATEAQLGELHNKVAKVMTNALDVFEKAQELYLDNAVDNIAPEVPASLMSVITKFLSDNKISCVPEESEGLSNLAQRLEARRAKRRRTADGTVVNMFPTAGEDD